MRVFRSQVAALAFLEEQASEERSVAFRQGMASLAQVAIDPAAVPFEGLEAESLLRSVRIALADKLLDELGFLPRAAAACALYAWATALPPLAPERRELGRRVLMHLHQDGTDSFVALATALALGRARAFDGPSMRARLELALMLPARVGGAVDALAFALISRRELAARFVFEPATGALPARRMAARLLERAARHAALRAQQGDDGELAIFEAAPVQLLFTQLASDREPLVSHHGASARGLLSLQVPRLFEELERDLMATHALARVRRGAISLAARIAVRPADSLERARELLDSPALAHDPLLPSALLQGLAAAFEVEREAAEELALLCVERGGPLAADALLQLRRDLLDDHCCKRAASAALKQLQRGGEKPSPDDGQAELLALISQELSGKPSGAPTLPELVADAVLVHARSGPLAAVQGARAALTLAAQHTARLHELDELADSASRRELFRLMHELDIGLLASPALFALFAAAATSSEAQAAASQLTAVLTRLLALLRRREMSPHDAGVQIPHLTLRMQRLRALLHLLDTDFRPPEEQVVAVHAEQLAAAAALYERVALDSSSAMDRIVHAALSRGVDALVRDELLESGDVLICSASAVPTPEGLFALAEGCLLPDLQKPLRALAELLETLPASAGSIVAALGTLAHALPSDDSPRTEALRRALLGLTRACEAMLTASSVRELVRARRALTLFEGAVVELAYLTRGARRRLGLPDGVGSLDQGCVAALARALESHAAQGEHDLVPTLDWLDRELGRALPAPFARATMRVLQTLRERPLEGASPPGREPLAAATTEAIPLPAWLPPSRRLGGFFVVRPLGVGLASSVFIVRSEAARREVNAPLLVLKVPRYDAHAARQLSSDEFEQTFADELPALLSVGPDEHLPTFVSSDSQRDPKPFLVMSWVEGPTLTRVRKRKLDPIALLDGIVGGLAALHAMSVGHLDVTPHNVVLRVEGGQLCPVLVDFGLAGRTPRFGCFHPAYAAPERWSGEATTPMAVDIYAVGCLAYELVTGRTLFEEASERQLALAHAEHDGAPPGVVELAQEDRHARLAEWITLCLRHEPRERPSALELRKMLRQC
jgi:hypothetical protein